MGEALISSQTQMVSETSPAQTPEELLCVNYRAEMFGIHAYISGKFSVELWQVEHFDAMVM